MVHKIIKDKTCTHLAYIQKLDHQTIHHKPSLNSLFDLTCIEIGSTSYIYSEVERWNCTYFDNHVAVLG